MTYGNPISQYSNTWYSPAPMTVKELRFKAMQNLIDMYDAACAADDYHLIALFNMELRFLSQYFQAEDKRNEC